MYADQRTAVTFRAFAREAQRPPEPLGVRPPESLTGRPSTPSITSIDRGATAVARIPTTPSFLARTRCVSPPCERVLIDSEVEN